MKRSVNTIIIESGTLLREGLVSLLHDSDFRVVSAVANLGNVPSGALERANLLIVGASSEPAKALDCVKHVSASAREIQIIVFTDSSARLTQPDIMDFLHNGADGCIFDVRSRDVLLKSLHLVVLGQRVVVLGENDASHHVLEHQEQLAVSSTHDLPINGDARLSTRELEILSYIAAGESNKLIARTCNLAESTVKIHLKAILRKIHVRNRTQAAVWAIQNADRRPLYVVAPTLLWLDCLESWIRDHATVGDLVLFFLFGSTG